MELGIILLAISLSMDAFGLGISYGLRQIKIPILAKLVIALISAIFMLVAVIVGNSIADIFPAIFSKVIGATILATLGVWILFQDKPISYDLNKSLRIDFIEALCLGVALSIDSVGAGIGSAIAGLGTYLLPVSAAVFQLLFLTVGTLIGSKTQLVKKVNSRVLTLASGLILIVLACFRLAFS